mgnify:FL=1
MRQGTPFEVEKEVFDRSKAQSRNKDAKYFYMTEADKVKLFPVWERCGYGVYSCMVHEEDGKYICTYETGDSCD